MKNTILKYSLIAATLFSTALYAKTDYTTLKHTGNHYISVGANYMKFEVPDFNIKEDSPAFEIGYGYRLNRYFEIGANININMEDKIYSSFVDHSVNINSKVPSAIVVTDNSQTYQNTSKYTFFTGLHLKASYPISDNFDLFATVGATHAYLVNETFYNNLDNFTFNDNVPYGFTAEEIQEGIALGLNDCQLTGNEEIDCGQKVLSKKDKINEISASYGIGIKWMFHDSGSTQIVNFGYKSVMDTDAIKASSLYVNYEWQF
jgi:opacity protein-like surface antigen